jgi:DNA polymerase-3 subunit delta'
VNDGVARLGDLLGQARATTVLKNAIRRDRVAHAYLFWGPDGVGKATAARLFAQALNCEQPSPDDAAIPCCQCRSCTLIARNSHPDVRVVTTTLTRQGQERTEISIDQIRQDPKKPHETPRPLIQDAYLKPALSPHKVYIVDPADRMSLPAANALLRALEDPPLHVVMVLVTEHPSTLLPTAVSRCQQVGFSLAGTAAVEQRLRGMGVDAAAAASLAQLSGGRPGWAIRAAGRPEVLATRAALLELCADIGRQPMSASLRMAEEIKLLAADMVVGSGASGEDASEEETDDAAPTKVKAVSDRALRAELPWCLDVMATWYRDCLAAAEQSMLINADCAPVIAGAAASFSCQYAEAAVEVILGTKQQIERNANIDLALECLAAQLAGGMNERRLRGVS